MTERMQCATGLNNPRRSRASKCHAAHFAARRPPLDAGAARHSLDRQQRFFWSRGRSYLSSGHGDSPGSSPTDVAALTWMLLALDAENEKQPVAMRTLKDMVFGKGSERLAAIVAEQLALEPDNLATSVPPPANNDAAVAKPPARRRGATSGRCPSTCRAIRPRPRQCVGSSSTVPVLLTSLSRPTSSPPESRLF
jgi:hypothetical protein